jgi:hypothetical protein
MLELVRLLCSICSLFEERSTIGEQQKLLQKWRLIQMCPWQVYQVHLPVQQNAELCNLKGFP